MIEDEFDVNAELVREHYHLDNVPAEVRMGVQQAAENAAETTRKEKMHAPLSVEEDIFRRLAL